MVDIPNSLQDVVNTTGMVLYEFLTKIKNEDETLNHVYDEQLSYETAVKKYRNDNELAEEDNVPFPLFAFKRSVMKHAEEVAPSRRMGRRFVIERDVDDAKILRSVHGQIDIDFLYIHPDETWLERFEIAYLAEEGISAHKEITLQLSEDFQEPRTLPYYVKWGVLDEKVFEFEDNFYKMLFGRVTIIGHYLTYREQKSVIKEINARIKDLMGPSIIYREMQIT